MSSMQSQRSEGQVFWCHRKKKKREKGGEDITQIQKTQMMDGEKTRETERTGREGMNE